MQPKGTKRTIYSEENDGEGKFDNDALVESHILSTSVKNESWLKKNCGCGGSNEEMTSPKSGKASPFGQELTNTHPRPDLATIQAYYGPGVPLPSPYLNSAFMVGHVPHPHVWVPPQQSVMPSYGVPYSTIYSPGVVCAHPAVPLVATSVSTQLLSKPLGNMDQGLTKKLKWSDGVAMQVVNDDAEVDGEGSVYRASQRSVNPKLILYLLGYFLGAN